MAHFIQQTGLADWIHINVWTRAIEKGYNDDSNKHARMTGLTQKLQLQLYHIN